MNRILGIDFGTRRIGLALSDPTGTLASPLPFLENNGGVNVGLKLREIVQAQGVETIVVGLPRNMDGSVGPSAQKVRDFIAQIQPHLSSQIIYQDERMSTVQAVKILAQRGLSQSDLRKKVDSASATLILQQFLDQKHFHP